MNYTEDVFDYIEELISDLKDKERRNLLVKTFCKGKAKVNKDCVIISECLKHSGINYSEMTVYRILRIRKESKTLYNQIRCGEIKIKEAYNVLFPSRKKEVTKQPVDTPTDETKINLEDMGMDDIIAILTNIEAVYARRYEDIDYFVDDGCDKLYHIDMLLQKIRRANQKAISWNMSGDET